MAEKTHFDILSPDGFSISRDKTWPTEKLAIKAAKQWVKGFKQQGHYSSVKYGRIPYEDILEYCELVPTYPMEDILKGEEE